MLDFQYEDGIWPRPSGYDGWFAFCKKNNILNFWDLRRTRILHILSKNTRWKAKNRSLFSLQTLEFAGFLIWFVALNLVDDQLESRHVGDSGAKWGIS